MEKAYKFRFYPTKTQITILNCTFGCVRYVYNHFLGLKQELYNKEKKSMSYNQCSKILTVLKQEKEWLKEYIYTLKGLKNYGENIVHNEVKSIDYNRTYIDKVVNYLKNFEAKGFPSKKEEAWKYTSLNAVLKNDFSFTPASFIVLGMLSSALSFSIAAINLSTFSSGLFPPSPK